jgi:hypothetical protein
MHTVMDVGGDGLPDLLVTARCNDATIDRDHWLVYESSGNGFAATPANFALPSGYSEFYGVATGASYCDNRNVPHHSMLDLGGDGRPDLVVTGRCNDTTIDSDHWLVYSNECAH